MIEGHKSLASSTFSNLETKEEIKLLAKEIVDCLYYRIICNNDIKVSEYMSEIASRPQNQKYFGNLITMHEQRRNYAIWLRRNHAFYMDVFNLLTQRIDTNGRVIPVLSELS